MRNNSQMEESLRDGISEVKKDHNTHDEFLPDYFYLFVCLFILTISILNPLVASSVNKKP